jgi:hypothetical protein
MPLLPHTRFHRRRLLAGDAPVDQSFLLQRAQPALSGLMDGSSAFPALNAARRGDDTVLMGTLPDQAALHGVLSQIEALGLELLEVRRFGDRRPGRT